MAAFDIVLAAFIFTEATRPLIGIYVPRISKKIAEFQFS